MRGRRFTGVLCALSALLAGLLAGCQAPSSGGTGPSGRLGEQTPAAAGRPSGYGAVFLAVDECSSFGTVGFTEVPCAGERAAARVVARHDGKASGGPPCPATTDFVLHISEQRPSADEDGDGAVAQGYACMRSLQPPHPGDPGGGGGPRTIVGDCLYDAGRGKVRETACDGGGGHRPRYMVAEAVAHRDRCPAGTALFVRLGDDERPVGCARSL
ncbi:hypothetical protein ACIRFH_01400 [Streptomyces sp. NPDC093586]|uniref:hypothetical protein n=1 Tax=Streptomyces sp. NPDC093586 TaxID=3366042 RepID=UPI0037F24B65